MISDLIPAFKKVEEKLKGEPDEWLTAALLVAAGVIVVIAFKGSSLLKAAAAAYVFFP